MLAFSQYPEQWTRLQADPTLVPTAVEEILRFVSPVAHMRRTVTAPVELHGRRLEPGARAFELFDSEEEPATQNELGLAVVYAIVTDSGGLVRLRSGEGHGARIEIFWPVAEREVSARRWLPLPAGRRAELRPR